MISRVHGYVLTIFASVCLLPPSAMAQKQSSDCSYLVANHTYAVYFGGILNAGMYFSQPGPPPYPDWGDVPNAGIGRLTFLANGTIRNTQTILVGFVGVTMDEVLAGTYSLKWDSSRGPSVCTGTMTEPDGNNHFQLIVSQNGQRLEMIHTDLGLGVNPTGFLMNTNGCSNKSIEGSYTYNTNGWGLLPMVVPSDQTFGGFVAGQMSGAMRFYPGVFPSGKYTNTPPPGAGTVKAWDTVSINGQIMPRTMTGWYTVDGHCSGKIVLNDGLNPEYIIEAYVGKSGDKVATLNVNTMDLLDENGNPSLDENGKPYQIPTFLMPIPLERAVLDDPR